MLSVLVEIIGGPGKTGSSTIAERRSEARGAKRIYTGGIMRREAIRAGFIQGEVNPDEKPETLSLERADLVPFRNHCEATGRNIDLEIDVISLGEIIAAVESGTPLVVDSKMAARLIKTDASWPIIMKLRGLTLKQAAELQQRISKQVRAVWLTATTEVRASRLLLKLDPTLLLTDAAISDTVAQLMLRQEFDTEMYLKYYGVDDYPVGMRPAGAGFGVIVDNSDLDHATTYAMVVEALGA
jgi:cytidylate kinase